MAVEPTSETSAPAPLLLLIDGHAHAYRAFHAIRDLTGPDGRPTNAIFGFVKAVEKLLGTHRPSQAAVVWDGGLAEERTTALPDYKANRPAMPDALERQLDEMVAWLEARGCKSLCEGGVEADDWIARLATEAAGRGARVLISTSDKDFMQLVSDEVRLLNPADRNGGEIGVEQVREKCGVTPGQVVDWLSLVGDSVDNIPGVPGVGRKTAAALLGQFGSCDAIYDHLSEVQPERIRLALEGARDVVRRNQGLVRLNAAAGSGVEGEELELRPANPAALGTLYDRWGFRSLSQAVAPKQGVLL